MTLVHPARREDADRMARAHVAARAETYAGRLPAERSAAATVERREGFWSSAIAVEPTRIGVAEGLGFASAGVQREAGLAAEGWLDEIHAIALLRLAEGLGQALFGAVRGARPFTCCELEGNLGASRFQVALGGRIVLTCTDRLGETQIREHVYGWR